MSKTIVKQDIEGSLGYFANGPMGVRSPMSKTNMKKGIEDKWGDCSNVSKIILKQGTEGSLGYCAIGPIGVSSPMSKTRPQQGTEEKWDDRFNVSNKIVKQVTEGSLGYCANGPMNIGKSYFEGWMTNYAHKCKTAEICKRKSVGGLHVEKKHHNCGSPPPQGECWSGLNPPILSTNNKVTGETTNMLRKENRKNSTAVRRSRDHKHIGLLMKKNLGCQFSCYHLARIKITCARQVWQFIT